MPRAVAVLLVTVVALALLSVSAAAESQTVKGTGDLKKLVGNNGRSAVTATLVGFGGPCSAKSFDVIIGWGTKAYEVQAACVAGQKWFGGLLYNPDNSGGERARKRVSCRGFSLKYAAATKSWKAVVPRSCMSKAPNRIRVKVEGINYAGSAMPGVAATKLLRRG